MESLICSRQSIPRIVHSNGLNNGYPVNPFHVRTFGTRVRPRRFLSCSKKSSFLDFQEYAKPRRLLPTTEPTVPVEESLEKSISSQSDWSESLYKVVLRTSFIYGSGLNDPDAGILICVIDENGDSILQRISAILCEDHIIHFQRGSTDEFIFLGPRLGRIQAMWISPESERLGETESLFSSTSYNFEAEDVLLGEGTDMAMAELRPSVVTEYSGADPSSLMDTNVKQADILTEKGITNEDSMKEYADLKYSLLLYDAMLIFAGTCISSFTASENAALAFFSGGIGGFLYLLLLQRSVDGLPASESFSVNNGSEDSNRVFGGLKGPLLVLAFALGVAVLVVKRDAVDVEVALTPREIMVGMMGFLACKISVLLAAFKPVSMSMKDNS